MIMYFKMMKISAVCVWLVKEQCVHSSVCLPSYCLPAFLASSFSPFLFLPSPNKQEMANSNITKPFGIIHSFTDNLLAPGHETQCPNLFFSTDKSHLDLL